MGQEARLRIDESQTPHTVSHKTPSKDGIPSSLERLPTDGRKMGTRAVETEKTSDFPFAVSVSDVYEGPLDLLLGSSASRISISTTFRSPRSRHNI